VVCIAFTAQLSPFNQCHLTWLDRPRVSLLTCSAEIRRLWDEWCNLRIRQSLTPAYSALKADSRSAILKRNPHDPADLVAIYRSGPLLNMWLQAKGDSPG
jgi:hypothetical protein